MNSSLHSDECQALAAPAAFLNDLRYHFRLSLRHRLPPLVPANAGHPKNAAATAATEHGNSGRLLIKCRALTAGFRYSQVFELLDI